MKRLVLITCLLTAALSAAAQHPQRMISELTACNDMECVEKVRKKYNAFKAYEPLRTDLDATAYEYMLDIAYNHAEKGKSEKKEVGVSKIFRLSLLVHENQLWYAQLEQLTNDNQLEATYLFKNQAEEIEQYLLKYNQQNNTRLTYKELIGRLTNRKPALFRIK